MRDMEQKLQHERQDHRDISSGEYRTDTNQKLASLLITYAKCGTLWGWGTRGMFAKVTVIFEEQKV